MKSDETTFHRAPIGRADILVTGERTGGRIALIEVVMARGKEPPRHIHHWEDETLYVLDGAMRIWLAGTWLDAAAGAAVFVPRGVEHGFAVRTDEARVLTALTPAGFEGCYRELAEEAPGNLDRLITTAARYGCEITGPPPHDGGG